MTPAPDLEVAPADVRAWIAGDRADLVLLDCRRPEEHALGHLHGALHIPMDELGDRLDELDPHRDATLVVYCQHGRRSLVVARALRARGVDRACSMAGGMKAWSELPEDA